MSDLDIHQFKGQPRLPKFVHPKRYTINLKPDLSSFTFAGSTSILLDIVAKTKFIILNSAELAISHPSVVLKSPLSDKEFRPLEVVLFGEDEILVLPFDDYLPLGEAILDIAFDGQLNDKMKGFYRSIYDHEGEKKVMAVTQFEAADARRCFPCWDEPAFKAIFKIILEVPSEQVALSNMPVQEERISGHMKTICFQESPIMSTYLVAVVIGLFDHVEGYTPDGTRVRVYCQVGKASLGKFALDVSLKTLDLYKDYFGVPYALPKLDMVAIPDFAAGAMENYGLITYREVALLYDNSHSDARSKQRVAVVVTHELAHQWFGNLVTMEWWTHLWLNEGFATWVSYLAADNLFPDWKVWNQFLDETTGGLRLDALAESHPIEVEIKHVHEIDEIFDAISYKKGASIIHMLQNYLGPDFFQKSLASYIRKYSWSNAKTEDLWAVLEAESGEPVKQIMDSWTKQKGYPVIYVKVDDGRLKLEQSQFLSSGLPGDGQWIVPVTLCHGSYDKRRNFLLKRKSDNLEFDELSGFSFQRSSQKGADACSGPSGSGERDYAWIKLNVDQTGFYRVQYDDELAFRLGHAIKTMSLSASDRFGILDDSYALCMACKQTLSSLLSLVNAYKIESEYIVLSCLTSISYKIVRLVSDAFPGLYNQFTEFFARLLEIPARKLGWDGEVGENHLQALLRGELLTSLALLEDEPTQKEALRRFSAFLDDKNTPLLPPNIRKAVYIAVMRSTCVPRRYAYDSLLRIYRETEQSIEKTRVLGALTSSPDPDMVHEALKFLLSSEVRNQDVFYGLGGISREGKGIAWTWLMDNWDYISKTWTGVLLGNFISAIVSMFSSEEKVAEIEAFFQSRTSPSFARTLKQSIERVHVNALWIKHVQSEKIDYVLKELTCQ